MRSFFFYSRLHTSARFRFAFLPLCLVVLATIYLSGGRVDKVNADHAPSGLGRTIRELYGHQPVAFVPSVAATATVNSTTDVADGDTSSFAALIATPGADGVISLREAITAANKIGRASCRERVYSSV